MSATDMGGGLTRSLGKESLEVGGKIRDPLDLVGGVDPVALDRLTSFWGALGSNVEVMDAAHHDLVLAITSHVPHLVAYNIVGTVADLEAHTKSEVIKFSASGFRDFTRIAASDPVMWRDVFLTNRDAVLEMLGRFSEDLAALQRSIRWGEGDKLEELFTLVQAELRRSGYEELLADLQRKDAPIERIKVSDLDVLLLRNNPSDDAGEQPWAQSAGIIFGLQRIVRWIQSAGISHEIDPELELVDSVAPALMASWYLRHFTCETDRVCDPPPFCAASEKASARMRREARFTCDAGTAPRGARDPAARSGPPADGSLDFRDGADDEVIEAPSDGSSTRSAPRWATACP